MPIIFRQSKNLDIIRNLSDITQPVLEPPSLEENNVFWVAFQDKQPVGFAELEFENEYAYLARAGVIPEARGQGIQQKFIQKRITYAKKYNCQAIYTYVLPWNCWSLNNLFKQGFTAYSPVNPYAGYDYIYLKKVLKNA